MKQRITWYPHRHYFGSETPRVCSTDWVDYDPTFHLYWRCPRTPLVVIIPEGGARTR